MRWATAAATKWTATLLLPSCAKLKSQRPISDQPAPLSQPPTLLGTIAGQVSCHIEGKTAIPAAKKVLDLLEIERQMIHSHNSVTMSATSAVEAYAKSLSGSSKLTGVQSRSSDRALDLRLGLCGAWSADCS
jgi:hypothetical protein